MKPWHVAITDHEGNVVERYTISEIDSILNGHPSRIRTRVLAEALSLAGMGLTEWPWGGEGFHTNA